MKFAGVDLHKRSLLVCVVDCNRNVLVTKRLMCSDVDAVRAFFQELGEFQAVVEATASYEWFVQLIEPFAGKVVLAHPGKMRVIAESKRKTDKYDARVLARALAADEVPEAYRPTPLQRDHRRLVRLRSTIQKRITAIKNQVRRIFSDHNADFPDLFETPLSESIAAVTFSEIERFELEQLDAQRQLLDTQLAAVTKRIRAFVKTLPAKEREDREILESVPQIGEVTSEVVLAELAGPERFSSQKKAVAYAGLVPGRRSSDGKTKELHIEKTGSGLLRWVLVEAAWRLVRTEPMWGVIFNDLARRKGKKKAIVAIARRLLCLMVGLLHRRERYDAAKLRHAGLEVIYRAHPELRDAPETPPKKKTPKTRSRRAAKSV
jgi:transposase